MDFVKETQTVKNIWFNGLEFNSLDQYLAHTSGVSSV